tara:strand:- start:555 stop:932 length:378 start_codon:yes stop_codon:yes gene_type:complete
MDEVISRAKRMGGGLIAILFILLIFGGNFLTTMFDATIFHVMPLIFLVFALVMAIHYESLTKRKLSLASLQKRKINDLSDAELDTINQAVGSMDNSLDIALAIGVVSLSIGLIGLFSLESITGFY